MGAGSTHCLPGYFSLFFSLQCDGETKGNTHCNYQHLRSATQVLHHYVLWLIEFNFKQIYRKMSQTTGLILSFFMGSWANRWRSAELGIKIVILMIYVFFFLFTLDLTFFSLWLLDFSFCPRSLGASNITQQGPLLHQVSPILKLCTVITFLAYKLNMSIQRYLMDQALNVHSSHSQDQSQWCGLPACWYYIIGCN